MSSISAVGIKNLWHAEVSTWNGKDSLNYSDVTTLIGVGGGATEIKNIHQDTWQIEESEPSQDKYKNQLTGNVYRMGSKEMGEVSISFTIGEYDYALKAALQGGTELKKASDGADGWSRARGKVEIKKIIIALTEDNVYLVFPEANISARESNTDKAIGLAVTATPLEPKNVNLMPEYWFETPA